MRVALLLAVASLCALAVGPAASASSSDLAVTYQVDVAHSGVQADDQLAPPFSRRWNVTLPGPVSYPLIAGGYVYVTVGDRKSTRLNSSHDQISYAVFCLKKKKKQDMTQTRIDA